MLSGDIWLERGAISQRQNRLVVFHLHGLAGLGIFQRWVREEFPTRDREEDALDIILVERRELVTGVGDAALVDNAIGPRARLATSP
jgi:hypothetical protein